MADELYRGPHKTIARRIVRVASANPGTKCWRCGLTLAEHPPHKDGTPVSWQAGHVVDGELGGQLAAEASTCNTRAGAIHGNALRTGLVPTRDWAGEHRAT